MLVQHRKFEQVVDIGSKILTLVSLIVISLGCGRELFGRDANAQRSAPHPYEGQSFSDRCPADPTLNRSTISYSATEQNQDAFRSVAVVSFSDRSICSSVLIAPDRLVSAAHCFESGAKIKSIDFADSVGAVITNVEVASIRLDPTYQGALREKKTIKKNPELSSYDVAVIRLKQPVLGRAPVALADTSTVSSGSLLSIVGAGDTGGGGGRKRYAPTHAGAVIESFELGNLLFSNLLLLNSRTGTGACPGDSGGGVFVNRGGRHMLLGVVSGINNALYPDFPVKSCSRCPGGLGVVTLLDAHQDFVFAN
jgi:hypothetical protein